MRLSSSALSLLTVLFLSGPGFAQDGNSHLQIECDRGVTEACFAQRYGRCANENPRIAIPACTRQLLDRDSVWNESRSESAFIKADSATRYALRATAYAKQGDMQEALVDYDRAIRAYDAFYWVHGLQGSALFAIGEEEEALASMNEAVRLAPNNALIFNARSRLLSTALDENVRNGPQAIADAQRAIALQPGQPAYIAALATAYAEIGEFENAVETQQRAIDMLDSDDQGAIDGYLSRLDLYKQGMPFRREMISCGAEDDLSDSDSENDGPASPYIAFCFADGRSYRLLEL